MLFWLGSGGVFNFVFLWASVWFGIFFIFSIGLGVFGEGWGVGMYAWHMRVMA